FFCGRAHLDPHSFPTRRSSDLVLKNSAISEIPRNLFHDLIFYGVKFDNVPELTAIHPQAFQTTEPFIEELYIRKARLGNERWKLDRKSTRLNSSHVSISYAVFC